MTGQTGIYPTLELSDGGGGGTVSILREDLAQAQFTTVIFPAVVFEDEFRRPLIKGFKLRDPVAVACVLCGYRVTQLTSTEWQIEVDYYIVGKLDDPGDRGPFSQTFECTFVQATFNR